MEIQRHANYFETINFKRLNDMLRTYYPVTVAEFESENIENITLEDYINFFEKKHIAITYRKTNAIVNNYENTYNFQVHINHIGHLRKLNRTLKRFSYYGIHSMEKAALKALDKAFEIAECLATGKELTEKRRRMK